MHVLIDEMREKGWFWSVEGQDFYAESTSYFNTFQDALGNWEQVKKKLGITYEIEIKRGEE